MIALLGKDYSGHAFMIRWAADNHFTSQSLHIINFFFVHSLDLLLPYCSYYRTVSFHFSLPKIHPSYRIELYFGERTPIYCSIAHFSQECYVYYINCFFLFTSKPFSMVLSSADSLQKSFFIFIFFLGGGDSLHPDHLVQNVCKGYQQTQNRQKKEKRLTKTFLME